MKKLMFVFVLLTAACTQIIPTPNDFPTPAATVIVEFPNNTPESQFMPMPYSVTSGDMVEAEAFLLRLQTNVAAGNAQGIAESVLYPIDVKVKGQTLTIHSPEEFIQNYDQLFDDKMLKLLSETNTQDLVSGPEGIRVGNGKLWFNLFCMDAACAQREFLITQIDN